MARLTDALACILAVVLCVLAVHAVRPWVDLFRDERGRVDLEGLRRAVLQEPPFGGLRRVRLLLLGADKRPGDVGRSDTLLLLFLNPQTGRAALLSLPRDLYVGVPGHGHTKLNHAYAYGGPALTRRTVQESLGLRVDHHAVIFFEGFVRAVDALGGVRVQVPDVEGRGRGMNYDDNAGHLHVHLKPGLQHLNGREALGFVRYRKSNARGLGDGDVGRAGRQQQFLKAMAEQHVQAASLPGLLAAAKEVSRHLETDMPAADLADLVRTLRACEPGDILTATVPLRSSGRHHGAYYAYADEGRLRRVLAQIDRHLDQGSARGPTVRVLNASGRAGQAAEVSRVLARKGFVTLAPGNAERSDLERTVIEYRPGHESAARRAARALRCGRLREAKEASGEAADLLVLVGRDFRP